ncbi:MAG: AIPR family protein [Raineya sp.]|nr:AIPR family protein [Raineya sp.]
MKEQIFEDIKLIQSENIAFDSKLEKNHYAFNYWILSKLYNIDEEEIPELITEYNDKSIDCFVHFEDSKELFLIQNKFYDDNTFLNRKEVSDFLITPLSILRSNKYKKSLDLQEIFNLAINDPEYKIWLHLYITNETINSDCEILFKDFNKSEKPKNGAEIRAKYFTIKDIYELYYGETFKDDINFEFTLSTINKATSLNIRPDEYNLSGMSKAHYILTPINQIYYMYKEAQVKKYPIFEENIREYLGKTSINNGIIKTLKDKHDRENFFYYNNGITIIGKKTETESGGKFSVTITKPQIVNGCQTVNTIFEVLNDYNKNDIDKEFSNVFVMVKVLVFDDKLKAIKPNFYKDIVRFTNKQNAINEDTFGANTDLFSNLKKYFLERGFHLITKPSDKVLNKTKSKSDVNKLIEKANKYTTSIGLKLNTFSDITIPLDKLLQIYLALMIDGYAAYKKKKFVLKPNSDIYKTYSIKIQETLNIDSMVKLFLLYKRSESEKKLTGDTKASIPYYLIGFLGYFIKDKQSEKINNAIEYLFQLPSKDFDIIFNYLKKLTNLYRNEIGVDYNSMIKKPIALDILKKQIITLDSVYDDSKIVQKFIENINN